MTIWQNFLQFLTSKETTKSLETTEKDVITIKDDITSLIQSLSLSGLEGPGIDIDILANKISSLTDEQMGPTKNLTLVYAHQLEQAAKNSQEICDSINMKKAKAKEILSKYADFQKREGKLTKALNQRSKKGKSTYQIFNEYMDQVDDVGTKAGLSERFQRATAPLAAITKDNDALLADMSTTLGAAMGSLEKIKGGVPQVTVLQTAANACKNSKSSIQQTKTTQQLRSIVLKIGKKGRELKKAQETLRQWRDQIAPALHEAETHLETDKNTIIRLRAQYNDVKEELKKVFKQTRGHLKETGKIHRGAYAKKAIGEPMDEIKKQTKALKEKFKKFSENSTKKGINKALHYLGKVSGADGNEQITYYFNETHDGIWSISSPLKDKLKKQIDLGIKKEKIDESTELAEIRREIEESFKDFQTITRIWDNKIRNFNSGFSHNNGEQGFRRMFISSVKHAGNVSKHFKEEELEKFTESSNKSIELLNQIIETTEKKATVLKLIDKIQN